MMWFWVLLTESCDNHAGKTVLWSLALQLSLLMACSWSCRVMHEFQISGSNLTKKTFFSFARIYFLDFMYVGFLRFWWVCYYIYLFAYSFFYVPMFLLIILYLYVGKATILHLDVVRSPALFSIHVFPIYLVCMELKETGGPKHSGSASYSKFWMTNILLGENSTPLPRHQQSPPEHMSEVEGTGQGRGHTGWLIHEIGKGRCGKLVVPYSSCPSPLLSSYNLPRTPMLLDCWTAFLQLPHPGIVIIYFPGYGWYL